MQKRVLRHYGSNYSQSTQWPHFNSTRLDFLPLKGNHHKLCILLTVLKFRSQPSIVCPSDRNGNPSFWSKRSSSNWRLPWRENQLIRLDYKFTRQVDVCRDHLYAQGSEIAIVTSNPAPAHGLYYHWSVGHLWHRVSIHNRSIRCVSVQHCNVREQDRPFHWGTPGWAVR